MHAIYKFSHDEKKLVQTIGTPTVAGADGTHFNRLTFLAWLPDSTMFVADGYNGPRVAKFDKDGKFLLDWGQKGTPPNDKRPGYMNNVHGIVVDPVTRHVFVNDRGNHRCQVFDQNGKYLYEWSFGEELSGVHLLYMSADRYVWAVERGTSKVLKYDLETGTSGIPGAYGGTSPAGCGVCMECAWISKVTFYVAEVDSGRVEKFRPRPGVNPAFWLGSPSIQRGNEEFFSRKAGCEMRVIAPS
jgi:DNA-binding beta-propeller fold protein YncE